MYLPLRFVQQSQEMLRCADRRSETLANALALKFAKELGFDQTVDHLSDLVTGDLSFWRTQYNKFETAFGIRLGSLEDFVLMMIAINVSQTWGQYKVVYKPDSSMLQDFCTMAVPKLFARDALEKLPAKSLYVDLEGQSEFDPRVKGAFVNVTKTDKLSVSIVTLVEGKRVMWLRSLLVVNTSGAEEQCELTFREDSAHDSVSIELEDGTMIDFEESKMMKLVINLLIYLQAANRRVEPSPVTAKTYKPRKPSTPPKNKFSEVQIWDVGTRVGRPVGTRSSSGSTSSEPTGRTVSSHYRCAHWHHYWTGSGESKELVVKWVEGTFVHGGQPSPVTIRPVTKSVNSF